MHLVLATSIWWYLATLLAYVLSFALSQLPVVGPASGAYALALFSNLTAPTMNAIIGGLSLFGLFVDMPVFWTCAAVALCWKLIWLTVRVWRVILELIPFVG